MKRLYRLLIVMGFGVAFWGLGSVGAGTESHVLYLPLVTAGPASPVIHSFVADKTVTDPGDTIVLTWTSSGGTAATLYHMLPSGQFGQFWDVPTNGSFTYDIPIYEYNVTRFLLFVSNATDTYDAAQVEVTLNCLDEWFFVGAPDVCPLAAPLLSSAAEQPFQHGTMIWIAEEDVIVVLFDDDVFSPKWSVYSDEWDEGDPVEDPGIVPPAGLYEPERGFGLVWREQPTVRDRLGWAVTPESAFVTTLQRTSYYKYNHTYIRSLDDMLWHLLPERSAWEKIAYTPR